MTCAALVHPVFLTMYNIQQGTERSAQNQPWFKTFGILVEEEELITPEKMVLRK